jgi:integrase
MSDPNGTPTRLTGRGEAPRDRETVGVEPPEHVVTGEVRYRGDEAQSAKAVHFDEAQLNQLALALAERMAAPKARWTFGELAARWLSRVKRVRLNDEKRNVAQLHPLFAKKEGELLEADITDWFNQLLEMGFSPVSVNKYRCAGRLVINDAIAARQWNGANPFDLAKRLKEPRRKYELLSLDEARRVLPHLRDDHRRMFRISLALGLRPGELFALRKCDVDFTQGLVHVHRSHARNTTKTGVARTLPLLACVAGDFLDAIRLSPSELVFPAEDGDLKRADTKSCRILRTAMGKAGVVTGYTFTCRKPGCEWTMSFAGPCDDMLCPTHDWKAWRTPTVKAVRWYDARHMAASFHRLAGADRLAVKLLLGHGGDITEDVYTHMGPEWFRRELSRFVL